MFLESIWAILLGFILMGSLQNFSHLFLGSSVICSHLLPLIHLKSNINIFCFLITFNLWLWWFVKIWVLSLLFFYCFTSSKSLCYRFLKTRKHSGHGLIIRLIIRIVFIRIIGLLLILLCSWWNFIPEYHLLEWQSFLIILALFILFIVFHFIIIIIGTKLFRTRKIDTLVWFIFFRCSLKIWIELFNISLINGLKLVFLHVFFKICLYVANLGLGAIKLLIARLVLLLGELHQELVWVPNGFQFDLDGSTQSGETIGK